MRVGDTVGGMLLACYHVDHYQPSCVYFMSLSHFPEQGRNLDGQAGGTLLAGDDIFGEHIVDHLQRPKESIVSQLMNLRVTINFLEHACLSTRGPILLLEHSVPRSG